MKSANLLRKRIAAIADAMKGTFTARFSALTDEEKAAYREWRTANERWYLRHERNPGDAYAAMLDGVVPPALPRSIRTKLFGPTPVITENMSADQAAEVYRRFAIEGE
jgi:hypothetical protein